MEYKEEVVEYIRMMDEQILAAVNLRKASLLKDSEKIEEIWYKYQKNVTEYGCDENWSMEDALEEVLGVKIPNHH